MLDAIGGTVAGATITATNQNTRAQRSAVSGPAGQYTLRGLPSGTWSMVVEAPGFTPAKVSVLTLSIGQVTHQNVTLQPAGTVERLEVKEEPEAIDVTASTSGVTLGGERIEEAPARSRNYLNFVLSAPAVAPSAGTSSQRTMTGTRTPDADSGFTFGGMRPRNNSILIDGMDNRDETTGGNRVGVGLEMVQEFRVSAAAIGAELGGAAGGLLNMVTRSGVNIWHGDFTFFAQNGIFNATRPEVDKRYRPDFERYQPGFSVMGPLQRDKTFISMAFEHEREYAQEWSNGIDKQLYPTSTVGSDLSTKLQHQISTKDTVSARYAFSTGHIRGEVQGPENFSDESAQGSSITTDHSLVGEWIRVATPTVVNSLRAQFAQRDLGLTPNGTGPFLDIPGVAAQGAYWRHDAQRTERHYQLLENLNFVWGRHHLSTGVDIHAVTLDADIRNGFAGMFIFPTLADYESGRPDVFFKAFGQSATQMTTIPIGTWLQDRVELRTGLQLELGVRFDRQRMPHGVSPSSNNVAPRIGLAWRPSADLPLVLRAGAGLFYDRYPLAFLNDAVQAKVGQYLVGPAAVEAFRLQPTAPLPGYGLTTWRTSDNFPSTYGRKLTFGGEYALDKNTSLTAEGIYLSGFHLPRTRNPLGTLPPQYLLEQTSRSEYLGGTVSVNHRLTENVAWLASYNFGRTKDDASDFDEQPLNPLDIRRDWGYSRQDQAHRVSVSGVFEPIQDLSIAPIYTWGTGRPLNALYTTDIYRTGAFPISARPLDLPAESVPNACNVQP